MDKIWYTSKMMWMNAIGIVAIIAQTQFGFVIDPEAQVAILGTINIVLRAFTGDGIIWSKIDE